MLNLLFVVTIICFMPLDDLGLKVNCPANSHATTLLNGFSIYNLYQINTIPNSRGMYLISFFLALETYRCMSLLNLCY